MGPNQYIYQYILSESIILMLVTVPQEMSLSVSTISMLVTVTQRCYPIKGINTTSTDSCYQHILNGKPHGPLYKPDVSW